MDGRCLKVKEVAAILGMGYTETLKLVKAGEIPTVDIPGRRSYLVFEPDVYAFIDRRRKGASAIVVPEGTIQRRLRTIRRSRKVDHKLDHGSPTERSQTQQNTCGQTVVKDSEFIIKPNWYK